MIEHAYPLAAAGTVAEHALLEIETVPVQGALPHLQRRDRCCHEPARVRGLRDWQVDVIGGEEMMLKRVEIETGRGGPLGPNRRRHVP